MKHLKNFNSFVNEQNINEAKVSKSDVKKLQNWGYNAEMYGKDQIVVYDGPNHWEDSDDNPTQYDYYWDGEEAQVSWSSDLGTSGDAWYTKKVTNVKDFMHAMETTKDWE